MDTIFEINGVDSNIIKKQEYKNMSKIEKRLTLYRYGLGLILGVTVQETNKDF